MPIRYIALDGHVGHNQAVLMVRENGLDVISKLRRDAALYEKDAGVYSGKGKPKRYGEQLNYQRLSKKYLKKSEQSGEILTRLFERDIFEQKFCGGVKCGDYRKSKFENKKERTRGFVFKRSGIKLGKVSEVLLFEVSDRVQLS